MLRWVTSRRVNSFRPLTGILFFNPKEVFDMKIKFYEFPSPYGDFVFQHVIKAIERETAD